MILILWWTILPWIYSKAVWFKWLEMPPRVVYARMGDSPLVIWNPHVVIPTRGSPWWSETPHALGEAQPTTLTSAWPLTHPPSLVSHACLSFFWIAFFILLKANFNIDFFFIPSKSLFCQKVTLRPSPPRKSKVSREDFLNCQGFPTSPSPPSLLRNSYGYLSVSCFSSALGSCL